MKIFKIAIAFAGFIFLVSLVCNAELKSTLPQPKNEKETMELFEKAVVNIFSLEGSKIGSSGTGFFISSDGLLLTNYHVMEDIFSKKQRPIYVLSDKTTQITESLILKCSDSRIVDICLVKLPYKPQAWFEVRSKNIAQEKSIFMIGSTLKSAFQHRQGTSGKVYNDIHKQFDISKGYEKNKKTEMVQLNAPLEEGFSGGPVFDQSGSLVGMSTVYLTDQKTKQKQFFAITAKELKSYIDGPNKNVKYKNVKTSFTSKEKEELNDIGKATVEKLPNEFYQAKATHTIKIKSLQAILAGEEEYCKKINKKTVVGGKPQWDFKDGKYSVIDIFQCR